MRDQLISQSDPQAHHQLGWSPRWDFATTLERTVGWYRQMQQGEESALLCCLADLEAFQQACGGDGREMIRQDRAR